jgi:hypothetical protein
LWVANVIYPKGTNNSIKFISNRSEWLENANQKKESKIEPACCYVNFKAENQSYGFLYNWKAYELLKNDPNLKAKGYRVATESDWNQMFACCKEQGTINSIYKCQEDNFDGFIEPNAFFDGDKWFLSEEMKSRFWVGEEPGRKKIFNFDCTKVGIILMTTNYSSNFDAYFIKFIKL